MVATWDSVGVTLGAGVADDGTGAADEGAGAADDGAGAVLAAWDSAGEELTGEEEGGATMVPVFCGGATHRVQIVMVEVTLTVESSVTTLMAVVPPWVIVLETGQLVTVV